MDQVKQGQIPYTSRRIIRQLYKGVPESVLDGSGLDVYQFRVYLFLYHQIGNGELDPSTVEISYKSLSEQTGISAMKVKQVVQELAELKLLSYENRSAEHGGNLPNSYSLYYPSPDQKKGY